VLSAEANTTDAIKEKRRNALPDDERCIKVKTTRG
jgi:hypothetical protein